MPFALTLALSPHPCRFLETLKACLGVYDLLVGKLVTTQLATWRKRPRPISFKCHAHLARALVVDRGSAASEPVSTVSTPGLTSSPVSIL